MEVKEKESKAGVVPGMSTNRRGVDTHADRPLVKPVRFGALAYTQDTQVYVGSGQERYLLPEHQTAHIMEQDSVLSLSSGSEAVIQRTPGPAGVGIELETSDVQMEIASDISSQMTWQETDWKGKVLINHGNWSITIDTTPFKPESNIFIFNVEIVVDGTKLQLDSKKNVMQDIGAEIKEALQTEEINEINGIFSINGSDVKKVVKSGNGENKSIWSDNTIFSVQVTCAMPLDKIYDLLDYNEQPSILNNKRSLSPLSDDPSKLSKGDKEVDAFLLLLAKTFSDSHDPKQFMPIMPRTSLGKIFMMLDGGQRKRILDILKNLSWGNGVLGQIMMVKDNSIGDKKKTYFNEYIDYLQKLHDNDRKTTTTEDLIKNHPEPLGIGKLGDQTEKGLDGKGEFPIFEFRRIGSCKLENLPTYLGNINNELMRILKEEAENKKENS